MNACLKRLMYFSHTLTKTSAISCIQCMYKERREGEGGRERAKERERDREVIFSPLLQAGLAPIRERLYRETVGRFGFRKEFARADAETMMEVLREIKKRSVLTVSVAMLQLIMLMVCV